MTQPILLTGQVYAVEVPEGRDAFTIECYPEADLYELLCCNLAEYNEPINEKYITLPTGNWQLIGTTKELTEEMAKGIVQQYGDYFIDHTATEQDWKEQEVNWFKEAVKSLKSLLISKGLDVNKNYVLLKKL